MVTTRSDAAIVGLAVAAEFKVNLALPPAEVGPFKRTPIKFKSFDTFLLVLAVGKYASFAKASALKDITAPMYATNSVNIIP